MTTVLLKSRVFNQRSQQVMEQDPKPQFCVDIGADQRTYRDSQNVARTGWFLDFDSQDDFNEFYSAAGKEYASTRIDGKNMLVVYV